MLHVLPLTFKPLSQQINVLQVHGVNTDWHTRELSQSLVAKQVCLGPVVRAACTDFAVKSKTSPCFLQQLSSQLAATWFVARQFWFVGCKTRNIAILLDLQLCCKQAARFLLPVLKYDKIRKFRFKSEFTLLQSSSRLFQLAYFVKCKRTLL